jgi:hypothetical protein
MFRLVPKRISARFLSVTHTSLNICQNENVMFGTQVEEKLNTNVISNTLFVFDTHFISDTHFVSVTLFVSDIHFMSDTHFVSSTLFVSDTHFMSNTHFVSVTLFVSDAPVYPIHILCPINILYSIHFLCPMHLRVRYTFCVRYTRPVNLTVFEIIKRNRSSVKEF